MERAIVTIRHATQDEECDLEVPVKVEARRLVELIVSGLQWDSGGRYQLWAEPIGRALNPQETLAQAGIWDGVRLVLQPQTVAIPPSHSPRVQERPTGPTVRPLPTGGPVIGWRDVFADVRLTKTADEPDEEPSSQPSGYVWKRLD